MNNKNTFSRDKLSHAIKNALSGVVCSLLFVLPVHAVEFNVDMIDAEDRENINISRFEKKGYIPPGRYLVRVQINKNMLPQTLILEWVKADNESGSLLCLTKENLTNFGLNTEFIESLQNIAGSECLDLSQRQELTTRLDKATMILSLSVPQAWLKYQSTNWTPPEFWDTGIAGFILDYNVYASQYAPHHGDSTQNVSSYGTLGFNLGAWRLRSDYQYNQNFADGRSVNRDSEFARTYLFRPIPSWSSKFTMGQYDLSSNLYDTFHFTGASLESDESMLPPVYRVMRHKLPASRRPTRK